MVVTSRGPLSLFARPRDRIRRKGITAEAEGAPNIFPNIGDGGGVLPGRVRRSEIRDLQADSMRGRTPQDTTYPRQAPW